MGIVWKMANQKYDKLKSKPLTSRLVTLFSRLVSKGSNWKILLTLTTGCFILVTVQKTFEYGQIFSTIKKDDFVPNVNLYEIRQRLLTSVCNRFRLQHERKYRRVVVWNKDKMIAYCPIEKCASSTWLERLYRQPGSVRWSYESRFPSTNVNQQMQNYFSFVFVRDPFVRLASAYRNKVMESNYFDWRNRIPKNFSNVPLNKRIDGYPTFEEFINFIVFSNQLDEDGDIDVHARPYWHQCDMCSINFTMIGKVESMRSDTDFILSRTKMVRSQPGDRLNQSQNRNLSAEDWTLELFRELPRGLVHSLIHFYEFEFEAFGYDFFKYM